MIRNTTKSRHSRWAKLSTVQEFQSLLCTDHSLTFASPNKKKSSCEKGTLGKFEGGNGRRRPPPPVSAPGTHHKYITSSTSQVEHITYIEHHIALHYNRVEVGCVCYIVVVNILVEVVRCNWILLFY